MSSRSSVSFPSGVSGQAEGAPTVHGNGPNSHGAPAPRVPTRGDPHRGVVSPLPDAAEWRRAVADTLPWKAGVVEGVPRA